MSRTGQIFALSLALAAPLGAVAEEIVTVSGRPGATQSYLLLYDAPPPAAVAVLFPGGEGLLGLRVEGGTVKFRQHGNFLVRTRTLLRDRQVAVAVVDSPSDQQRLGMDDGFRTGRAHVADVAAVVKDLRQRFPGAKIFLIGTSAIKAPLLFVHHRYDACRSCPYNVAESLGKTYPLITVIGGKPAESDPCEPFAAHGYFGKEAETVAAIRNWMLGQVFPTAVD